MFRYAGSDLFSTGAEQAILGAVISDDDCWIEVTDRSLSPDDFFHKNHRLLYQAVVNVRSHMNTSDLRLVIHELKEKSALAAIGGESYIKDLLNLRSSSGALSAYVQLVKSLSLRRKTIEVSQKAADIARHHQMDQGQLTDQLQPLFNSLYSANNTSKWIVIKDSMLSALKSLGQKRKVIKSGYKDLDNIIEGFERGSLNIVAARPSMGKTAFAINILRNYAYAKPQHAPILFFSLEMSTEQITMRLLSSLTSIDGRSLSKGELSQSEVQSIQNVIKNFSQSKIYLSDSACVTQDSMLLNARRIHLEHGGIDLIIIDYVQLMSSSIPNRTHAISEISRRLKVLAQELNVPIIALSQLNRNVEERIDRRPILSDLRDSGSLEQDADRVLFLYRESVYNPDTLDRDLCEVIVGKNRHGPIGKVFLRFKGKNCRFVGLS